MGIVKSKKNNLNTMASGPNDPICDIFPDTDGCQAPEPEPEVEEPVVEEEEEVEDEEVTEEPAEGAEGEGEDEAPAEKVDYSEAAASATAEWQRVKDMSSMAMMMSPMGANLTMGGVALGMAMDGALQAFRYRSDANYYTSGKVGTDGTNYWELSDQIRNFSKLGLGGILAVTSILSAVGGMTLLNYQAWTILGLVGMVAGMAVDIIRMVGYDSYYSDSQTTATAAAGASAMTIIKTDAVYDMAAHAVAMIELAPAMEGFYHDVWNAKTDEEQADAIAEWEETIATRAADVEASRSAAAPAE